MAQDVLLQQLSLSSKLACSQLSAPGAGRWHMRLVLRHMQLWLWSMHVLHQLVASCRQMTSKMAAAEMPDVALLS